MDEIAKKAPDMLFSFETDVIKEREEVCPHIPSVAGLRRLRRWRLKVDFNDVM